MLPDRLGRASWIPSCKSKHQAMTLGKCQGPSEEIKSTLGPHKQASSRRAHAHTWHTTHTHTRQSHSRTHAHAQPHRPRARADSHTDTHLSFQSAPSDKSWQSPEQPCLKLSLAGFSLILLLITKPLSGRPPAVLCALPALKGCAVPPPPDGARSRAGTLLTPLPRLPPRPPGSPTGLCLGGCGGCRLGSS